MCKLWQSDPKLILRKWLLKATGNCNCNYENFSALLLYICFFITIGDDSCQISVKVFLLRHLAVNRSEEKARTPAVHARNAKGRNDNPRHVGLLLTPGEFVL